MKVLMPLMIPTLRMGPVGHIPLVIARRIPPGTTSLSLRSLTNLCENIAANANSTMNKTIARLGVIARTNPFAMILGVLRKIYRTVVGIRYSNFGSLSPFSRIPISLLNLPNSSCWKNRKLAAVKESEQIENTIDIICHVPTKKKCNLIFSPWLYPNYWDEWHWNSCLLTWWPLLSHNNTCLKCGLWVWFKESFWSFKKINGSKHRVFF